MENIMTNISSIISLFRYDNKDIRGDASENQHSTYSQCKYYIALFIYSSDFMSCFIS